MVANDALVVQQVIQAALDGEVDSHNDMGRFRRRSHRGSRAEAQTLKYLGERLEELKGEWEEVTNQARFLFAERYSQPVRLVYCRGELKADGQTFRINSKGQRTWEMLTENRMQLPLFERTETTPSTQQHPIEEKVTSFWIVADTSKRGHLSLYLAHGLELRRDWSKKSELGHMNLICDIVCLLWEGSLTESSIPLTERPEAEEIDEPFLEDRNDEDETATS